MSLSSSLKDRDVLSVKTALCPCLGISFYIDYLLFGVNFLGYNLHSLFLLVAVGFLAYLFLQQVGLHRWPALTSGITLMVSPAMVAVAGHYSIRHYLFGFAFALLSLMMLLKWCTTSRSGWFFAAVLCYFLALCSKEIYAPLLVIAAFSYGLHPQISRKP
jgi:hypothetical protein